MGTVTLPQTNKQGQTNNWTHVEDNDVALRDEINGNLDNSNLSAAAAIAHSKLANASAGRLLIANGSGVITATAMSGDATISSTGVVSLATDSVGAAEIASGAVGHDERAAPTTTYSDLPAADVTLTPVNTYVDVLVIVPTNGYYRVWGRVSLGVGAISPDLSSRFVVNGVVQGRPQFTTVHSQSLATYAHSWYWEGPSNGGSLKIQASSNNTSSYMDATYSELYAVRVA